mmetsp:Transcript_30728/g.98149  ORF Transcript_30728/g.98149 Transcript_30728/m.98149 type:complete len:157 (+) Transcript_30728:707-1177(+)
MPWSGIARIDTTTAAVSPPFASAASALHPRGFGTHAAHRVVPVAALGNPIALADPMVRAAHLLLLRRSPARHTEAASAAATPAAAPGHWGAWTHSSPADQAPAASGRDGGVALGGELEQRMSRESLTVGRLRSEIGGDCGDEFAQRRPHRQMAQKC